MKFFKFSLLVFLLTVAVSTYNPLVAEEEKWQLVYETDGIDVYRRVMEGSQFLEFKATGNIRGTISDYVSVILDTDEHPAWAPRCLETRNIEKVNDQELIIYAAYAGVWPTADRDYAARMSIVSEPDIPAVRVDIERVELSNTPPVSERVHIPHLKSCWIFEQVGQDITRVELRAHVDPGGWIPAWLVNWGYRKIPYQFLKNLESQVARRLNHTSTLATIAQ
ncbi:MAG: START domain-containing protein [Candidatus Scalindua sp.]|nr:START domain-containing protein [Candidatus Scalindua sp.]MCR4344199.1 START domain-containing protein [Candidatus Scalindua sp.]